VVELTYQKFGSEEQKTYELDPYLLKEYRNRWYLIAHDRSKQGERTFGLERIRALNVTEEHYARLEAFDPDRYFTHSIGITVMDELPQDIAFRVNSRQAPYVESQPIHPSQEVLERTDDHVTFSIHVLITFELISSFLGMGDQVEVLKPQLLRNHLLTLAENIARAHR
jgi:predicted DNA-binding transcriptional regulator YafY